MAKASAGEKVFNIANYIVLAFLAGICLLPFVHLLAVSFSSSAAATSGRVGLWPIEFTLAAYKQAIKGTAFIRSLGISVMRVVLGVTVNLVLMILTAYPLSKSNRELPGRTVFAWFFIITMLISGGLIPTYLVVINTGLKDSIWALIIPGAVSAYNVTVTLNFFRTIPKALEECALIDGASQLQILLRVYIPLSVPVIATMLVFCTVGHWNEWFSGMIYMSNQSRYPLMTYLRTIITQPDYSSLDTLQLEELAKVSSKTYQAAQILISTAPILAIYPLCQRHFVKGMILGSVKE